MDNTTPRAIGFPLPEVHSPNFRLYDAATDRVACERCHLMIDSTAWAKPCAGLPGGVHFDHIFKPGVEGANHTGDRATESHESPSPSTPSQTNQGE